MVDNVMRRERRIALVCLFCRRDSKSVSHIFWECAVVRRWWPWILEIFNVQLVVLELKYLVAKGKQWSCYIDGSWTMQ